MYRQPAGEYKEHVNREIELNPANREWRERNGTERNVPIRPRT